jgi:S1-C subfamily serine protease
MNLKIFAVIFTAFIFLTGCSESNILSKKDAVVFIVAEKNLVNGQTTNPTMGSGTGFFIDENVILTNNHVVENSKSIIIQIENGKEVYPVEVVFADPLIDVAVLKLKNWEEFIKKNKVSYLEFAQDHNINQLDTVYAIGHPWGLQFSISKGVISHTIRRPSASPKFLIQTDANIFEGNSGGPLLNSRGNVVGINTLMLANTGGSYGFATPSLLVKKVLNDYKKYKEARWIMLGVIIDNHGVIQSIQENSAASGAGLLANDKILSMEIKKQTHEFTNFEDFIHELILTDYEELVKLEIERGNEKVIFELKPTYKLSVDFLESTNK